MLRDTCKHCLVRTLNRINVEKNRKDKANNTSNGLWTVFSTCMFSEEEITSHDYYLQNKSIQVFPTEKIPAPVTPSPVLLFFLCNVAALWIHAGFNSSKAVVSLLCCPDGHIVFSPLFTSSGVSVRDEIKKNYCWNDRKL